MDCDKIQSAVKERVDSHHSYAQSFEDLINNETEELKKKAQSFERDLKDAENNINKIKSPITLNVGGETLYPIPTEKLLLEGSLIYFMFASGKWEPDKSGCYFIDENPNEMSKAIEHVRSNMLTKKIPKRYSKYFEPTSYSGHVKKIKLELQSLIKGSGLVVKQQNVNRREKGDTITNAINRYEKTSRSLVDLLRSIKKQMELLDLAHSEFNKSIKEASDVAISFNSPMRLNVGGKIFATTRETLSKHKDTPLFVMASQRWKKTDDEDLNPYYFGPILEYLRTGIPSFDGFDGSELRGQLDFLMMGDLPPPKEAANHKRVNTRRPRPDTRRLTLA